MNENRFQIFVKQFAADRTWSDLAFSVGLSLGSAASGPWSMKALDYDLAVQRTAQLPKGENLICWAAWVKP